MFVIMVPSMRCAVASVSRARERVEALLDVGRQDLERADVELFRRVLHLRQVDPQHRSPAYFTSILRSRTTFAQRALSSRMASANCAGVLPTGTMPSTKNRARISVVSSIFAVSR